MKRTRVKICGIQTLNDALAAVNAGTDAIGLNFYSQSQRCIDVDAARSICSKLPTFVTKVALFVNPTKEQVAEVLDRVNIDTFQFHGSESEAFCQSFNKPYIKALSLESFDKLAGYSSASALLLDSFDPQTIGGTGETFDWQTIPKAYRGKIILAGGLTPSNVALAIKNISPYALDVSSGVEALDASGNRIKGKKDHKLMTDFVQAVQSADLGISYK